MRVTFLVRVFLLWLRPFNNGGVQRAIHSRRMGVSTKIGGLGDLKNVCKRSLYPYLDTAYELFKMVGVMPDSFIRYPQKTVGTMGLFFKANLFSRKNRPFFCLSKKSVSKT
jgi:hypothetical protein